MIPVDLIKLIKSWDHNPIIVKHENQSQITADSVIPVDVLKLIKSWDHTPIIVKHGKSVWKIGQNIPIDYLPYLELFLEKRFQKAPVLYSSRYRLSMSFE